MTQSKGQDVILVVTTPIHLDDVTQVVLPPGRYHGERVKIERSDALNTDWTDSEYKLELSKDQLLRMARVPNPSILQVEYDVTAHVRNGQIRVE